MDKTDSPRDPSEAANDIYELTNLKNNTGYFWSRGKKRSW